MDTLPTKTRLKRTKVFRDISQQGRWVHSSLLSLGVKSSGEPGVRFGIRIQRGLPKAVVRNRLKRQIRSLIRRSDCVLSGGVDMVVVVHPKAHAARFSDLNKNLVSLCIKQSIFLSGKV